ncbi:MAG: ABC transporter permease [Sandaracinaceae bacterium]
MSDLFALRGRVPSGLRSLFLFLAPAALIGTWCALSYGGVVHKSFLPTPDAVAKGLLVLIFEHELLDAVWASTRRMLIAFSLAAGTALPLGILMGAFEPVNRFFDPIMAPLRFMPIVAFIPLMIVWFGIDEMQKIAFLFLGVFVFLVPVVVAAIRAVPQEYVDTAYTLGATRFQVIRTVLIPSALPETFESFRVMNAMGWTYVTLAESVNPQTGLGHMIDLAYSHSKPEWSFAGLFVIAMLGLTSDSLIRFINAILFRWRETQHG